MSALDILMLVVSFGAVAGVSFLAGVCYAETKHVLSDDDQ